MIFSNVGTIGSGKSLDAVVESCNELQRGRHVYTNIYGFGETDDSFQAVAKVTGLPLPVVREYLHVLKDEDILHLEDLPKGVFIVLDEVHKFFSNRNWQSEANVNFTTYAAESRHLGHDILLVTQTMDKVDKHIRSSVNQTNFFRPVMFLGKFGNNKYIRYTYEGDSPSGHLLSQKTRSFNKKYFECYKSAETFSDKKPKGKNIFFSWQILALPIVLCLLIYSASKSNFSLDNPLGVASVDNKKKSVAKKTKHPKKSLSSVAFAADVDTHSENAVDDSPEVDPRDVIKMWNVDGKVVYTNNNIRPYGGDFVRDL